MDKFKKEPSLFKKIGKNLNKTWEFFNGKKTAIGTVLALGTMGVNAFFPNALTPDQAKFLEYTGWAIAGGGGLHKLIKWPKFQDKAVKPMMKYTGNFRSK